MLTRNLLSITIPALALVFTACGKNNDPGSTDEEDMKVVLFDEDMTSSGDDMAEGPEDMGQPGEDLGLDMYDGEDMSATPDMADPRDMGGFPSTCEGACATQDLSATYGATTEPFERAVYGLSAPETTESGEWEVYLEALDGGFEGCPQQDSPTPARTMIVANLKIPTEAGVTYTKAEHGIATTLLDFDGTLFTEEQVFERADTVELTPQAGNLCVECVGMAMPSHMEGFIALDLSATFPSGTASGHIYAVHCDSLDTMAP